MKDDQDGFTIEQGKPLPASIGEQVKEALDVDHSSGPQPGPEVVAQFAYSLVLAEVVYQTGKHIASHRVQLFSKADTPNFPAGRVAQIQNTAAHQAKGEITGKDVTFLETILLNILPLGWMTDEEFWGSKLQAPSADVRAAQPEVLGSRMQVAPPSNNVVTLKRP